jgi:hypothetical protein
MKLSQTTIGTFFSAPLSLRYTGTRNTLRSEDALRTACSNEDSLFQQVQAYPVARIARRSELCDDLQKVFTMKSLDLKSLDCT